MLKVGLIGAGFMGGMHAACYQGLSENVKVVAVADLVDEKAEAMAKKFGAKIFTNGMELIDNAEVDIIDICLPTYLHTTHAIKAMEKGRAVFIEKPVCLNLDEAKLLLDTQEKTGAKVMVGQCIRMWDEYAWLKKTIESKIYGKVISGVFKRLSPKPTWAWENWLHKPECSGSVALDLHIHDTDYIRYIMGEPQSLFSEVARDKEGVIQQIFTTYTYEDAVITAEGVWDYPPAFPFCMEYRIKFEKATVVFNSGSNPPLVVYPVEGGQIVPELEKDFVESNEIGGNISSLGGYYNELKYFVERLQNGQPLEVAPLLEGIKSVELVLKEIDFVGGAKL